MKRALSIGFGLLLFSLAVPGVSGLDSPASATSAASELSAPIELSATTESHIVIFHCNDVHGKIDNFAKVAILLDAERKSGADVFFFSAGDNFTGDPVIDKYDPPGEPIVDLLGRLHLDVLTLGNHEFDYGMDAVRRLTARFRTVSANIEPLPGVLPELKPYVVLTTKGGIKLVVFGLIQIEPGSGLPSTHPDKVKGLRFSDPLAKALELKKLRSSGQVLIGLTHIGHDQDLLLAQEMPELDLIIGGHSHTRVEVPDIVNGVLVAQAGGDDQLLGRIDLRLEDGRIVEKKGRLIDLGTVRDEDPALKALIAKYHENPVMARVIAKAPLEISGKDALGSLMTDAIRLAHGLDIVFQNNGGIRLNRLPQVITLHDAYTLDPFGNQVIEFNMTPAEIRSLIRNSCERRHEIDLQVSGISYIVHEDGAKQIREIKLLRPDGLELAEDRTYKVGLSSYIASSYRFDHKDPGRSLQSLTVDALIQYLESGIDLGKYRDVQRAIYQKAGGSSKD
jgi:5'-nucleotidase/UDP-sugar diphosphatase